jgi:HK97 gp10 family phage protein
MDVKVRNNLPRITSQIEKALSEAVRKAAFGIEATAKTLCPVDTGTLHASLQTRVESPTKATVGTSVEYAQYQEFGTRHQKGKAFLTPAADAELEKFQKELQSIEGL